MKRRLKSTFPLIITVLLVPMLLLIGFLINHITLFVDFFTVKNTVITILVIYAIIANWVTINLQFQKREIEHQNEIREIEHQNEIREIEYEESLSNSQRERYELKDEIGSLKSEIYHLKETINQNKEDQK